MLSSSLCGSASGAGGRGQVEGDFGGERGVGRGGDHEMERALLQSGLNTHRERAVFERRGGNALWEGWGTCRGQARSADALDPAAEAGEARRGPGAQI